MKPNEPAVMWPLWRRLRFFGGMGVICAAIAIAMELLFADIPGERAFNRFNASGSPLWASVRMIAIWLVTSGLAIGVLLPLYRHRHGGAAIGLAVYALLYVARVAAFDGSFEVPDTGVERLQVITFVVGFAVIAVLSGLQGRSLALGEPDDSSSGVPPVA